MLSVNADGNAIGEYTASGATVNASLISGTDLPAGTAASQPEVQTATTTTLAASSNPITVGQLIALTATVTSGSGSPTGTVTFMDGSTLIGSVAIGSGQKAVGFTASLPVGSDDITASYNGASGFATSSDSLTETVNAGAATTTTLAASSNPIIAGQARIVHRYGHFRQRLAHGDRHLHGRLDADRHRGRQLDDR